MTTIAEVARYLGVSTATVSRSLSGAGGVSTELRNHVIQAARALGYRPNTIARALRTTRTQTIGLIVSDVVNPFFGELALAIEEAAHRHGFSVILCNTNEEARRQEEHIELLMARYVDGLLLTPTMNESSALRAALDSGVPVVFVDRGVPSLSAPIVRANGTEATIELVNHLVALGHERIAVISGPRQTLTGRERLKAFRAALRSNSLDLPREFVRFGNFQMASGERAAAQLLDLPDRPTAVFVADNLMALGALSEVRRRGLRVGDDLAVAGFDDPPWFRLLDPPMTTVSQPVGPMGSIAVETLVAAINGDVAPSHLLGCQLVVRASCGEHRARPAGRRGTGRSGEAGGSSRASTRRRSRPLRP